MKLKYNVLYLSIILLFMISMTACSDNNKNLMKFKSETSNANSVSLNGQTYSVSDNFVATNRGKKIGITDDDIYAIYEIKGLSYKDWVSVNFANEPGLGQWVCKNDNIRLTIENFDASKIKIKSDNERSTIKTINDIGDIQNIIKAASSGVIVKNLVGDIEGKNHFLYFISPKYPGIVYREGFIISTEGKYYYHLPGNTYIDMTDILKKFVD